MIDHYMRVGVVALDLSLEDDDEETEEDDLSLAALDTVWGEYGLE